MSDRSIGRMGIYDALLRLAPYVRQAGQAALALQPQIVALADKTEKGGNRFASAITDADYLIEDRLGLDVLVLFDDASYFGEEREKDRVSRYVAGDHPYIITCDPVNGTLYYRDGLPIFEVILTICNRKWEMLGALVYSPALDLMAIGYNDARNARYGSDLIRWDQGRADLHCMEPLDLELLRSGSAEDRLVYLSNEFIPRESHVRNKGYWPLYLSRDYAGQPKWPHTTCNIVFPGPCLGAIRLNGQLIDTGATGFIVQQAGGFWSHGPLDPATMKYPYSVMAVDEETHRLLESLL